MTVLRAVSAGLSLALLLSSVPAPSAVAQSFDVGSCYERCAAEFSPCLGEVEPPDPPIMLEPEATGESSNVLTPPPYEFCLAVKQACDATCNAEFLTSRVTPKP